QLYYPESPYSFAVFSSDVLGTIYEIFLSEQLVIDKNNEIKLIKKPENADRDIITTPTFVIQDILRKTVQLKTQRKTYNEICQLKFADISCGSGAFLLELFQLLNDNVIDYFISTDKSQLIQTAIETYKLPYDTKRNLLVNCVFGVDKDYNAVESAKFGLLLKLLENEDSSSITARNQILPSLDQNIYFGNSLIEPGQVLLENEQLIINPFEFGALKFDAIVGNPPYMKSEDMKNITPFELPIYKTIYTSSHKQFDKYFLFIERGLNLLKKDGLLGYIVPSKFTKVGAGMKLRENLANNRYLFSLVSFGANQLFADKTTYTSILILSKSMQEEFTFTEIKSLPEWKIRNYDKVISATIKSADLSSDLWFLIPPYLKDVYDRILKQSVDLEKLVGKKNINNGIQTSANDVYIIHAIKEENGLVHFEKDDKSWAIEKAVLKPYYETVRKKGEEKLNTYRTLQPNTYVIFPYVVEKGKAQFISEENFTSDFPETMKYLQANKTRLQKRDIKPVPKTDKEWYRFGRSQYLELGAIPEKIFIGVMSAGEKYPIDFSQTLHTAGGTAGYCSIFLSANCPYSIYYIQAILNSKYVEWIINLRGEIFRGGYIARGTKVLKNLPILAIDFENMELKSLHDTIVDVQKQLIIIQGQIDSNVGDKRMITPLLGKFSRVKNVLDELLKKLFGLGEDDLLIPSIKELYEIN
ncbi:MAG: Eco57I restriction-modification methylase domain-containing protein, partial [Flavobacteriaceae bacterium]|nr:Eco57I restriction-modification methylase domain-containing protein [Flavobacteriaceae bacterium]